LPDNDPSQLQNYEQSFFYDWDIIFGSFNASTLDGFGMFVFHAYFTFVLNLMAANLVISVIGGTYSRMEETKEIIDLRSM
jgi:hypothetical protein